MEFDLEQLRRDWISGIPGEALCARVQAYRSQLSALSPEQQAQGAVIAETDPIEFAAVFFAVVSLEMPAVLANPNWGAQEWGELAQLVAPSICFGRNLVDLPDPAAPPPPTASILIPTGGTTGGVKLAIHTWASLEAACRGVEDFLGGGAIDSCCVLPLYHVSGLMQLLRSFISGGNIRFDEDAVAGCCLSYVPTQLRRAMADPQRILKIKTARAIFVGGAGMPESVASRARELELPVVPVYGMTETAAMVAAVPNEDFLQDPQAGAVPLGEACFIIESGGQIRVQTPALFQGYQGRAPVDLSRGYLTGDQGCLDDAGRLHVYGRVDRLINTGGEKVDPVEVEAALLQIESIDQVRVYGEPDPEWGQIVVAEYTSSAERLPVDWKTLLKAALAPHKIPKKLMRVNALPVATKLIIQ